MTIPGHVPDEVAKADYKGPHNGQDTITITVALKVRDFQALLDFLRDVNDPASPRYHQFLSQNEANQIFNPTVVQEQAVSTWLTNNGLHVKHSYPNHLLIDAEGTVAQIEHLLGISINDYVGAVEGKQTSFYAPASEPTVPASVSAIVGDIVGLDNITRFHTSSNGTAHNTPAYYPQDLANAYDVNPLWNAGNNGSGQNIAITLWTVPPSDSTLQAWASRTGAAVATKANGRLKVIPVDGGTTTVDQGEAGLDIESAGGIAPASTIRYYEAPTDAYGSPTSQGLLDALNLAGTDSALNRQITNSWGGCENNVLDSWTKAAENIFATNSATGHNYFFSSGDNGSWCDPFGTGTGQATWADYPASSPNVTSVGGSRFSASINGGYPGEVAWQYCGTCASGSHPLGTGGGYSTLFSRPSWQTGSGLATNGKRGYPDISAIADPATGFYTCYGAASACGQFGGTSLASPVWAGVSALLNQYLSGQGKPALGSLNPVLYKLATQTQTYAAFHDITSGTNGSYSTSAKWDAVTGWGTPDAYNLARDLAGTTSSTPTSTPAPTTTGTAQPTATKTAVPTATKTSVPPTGTSVPAPTATSVPTATRTSTPAPTATSVPSTVTPAPTSTTPTQLLTNGGFESGTIGWTFFSASLSSILDTTLPHSPTHDARLCAYNSCFDLMSQTVTVPSGGSITLSYWEAMATQDLSVTCADQMTVQLKSMSGTVITTPQQMCSNVRVTGYNQKSYDLTSALAPYAGQQVQLVVTGQSNATAPTTWYLDDFSLMAGSSAGGTVPTTTPVPSTPTQTPAPTATRTSVPTATGTPAPTATRTSTPAPTSTSTTGSCPGSQTACAQSLLAILNQDRAAVGVAPLTINWTQSNGTASCVGSVGHSQAMQQSGTIWHTNPSYPAASFPTNLCVGYSTAGENVGQAAYGNELTDLQKLDGMMMAEAHDAATCASQVNHACNIINPNYHQVGIGLVNVSGGTWLTEDFTN